MIMPLQLGHFWLFVVLLACVGYSFARVVARQEPPAPANPLPACALPDEMKFQPVMDWDLDGCYNVPAIGPTGFITEGMDPYTGDNDFCHDEHDVRNSNVYVRKRCNNGWCGYMYDYFFEKDASYVATGHKYDWEQIVVWVQNDKVKFVGASQHGNFETLSVNLTMIQDGTHPQMVYHLDGDGNIAGNTHAMRFGNPDDDDHIENATGIWFAQPLVSYNGFPPGLRDKLYVKNFGDATMGTRDASFTATLGRAIPNDCSISPTNCHGFSIPDFNFDPAIDDGSSPGTPQCSPTITTTSTTSTRSSTTSITTSPTAAPLPPNPKVMIVGDSMTQGKEGDWTWRYRIWQWFQTTQYKPDFVGPYTYAVGQPSVEPLKPPAVPGEESPPPQSPTTFSGRYAADTGRWDSQHFSTWGRQLAKTKNEIEEQVRTYTPDLMLVMLGFNDVGWFVSGPDGTLDSMKTFVANARRAKPNVRIAFGNIPRRTTIGGREDLDPNTLEYNRMFKPAIANLSTPLSPISFVDIASAYSCGPNSCPAAYDGLHPKQLGDYEIARAFSIALNRDFKIGSGPLTIPIQMPVRPLPVPSNFRCAGASYGVRCDFNRVFGSYGYDIRVRIRGQEWSESHTATNVIYNTLTVAGVDWDYQVRSTSGEFGSQGAYTGVVSVKAKRTTAPPPENIVSRATPSGFTVSWAAVPAQWNPDVYAIGFWDSTGNEVNSFLGGQGARGTSTTITGLNPGRRFNIFLETWNDDGPGLPAFARPIVVGAGKPPAPTNLEVRSVDATTVSGTWTGSNSAAGYLVYIRNINNASDTLHTGGTVQPDTTFGAAYLFPGTWNYQFCVSAINGQLESGKSNCVIPARP